MHIVPSNQASKNEEDRKSYPLLVVLARVDCERSARCKRIAFALCSSERGPFRAMKLEALLATLCPQLVQVGVRKEPWTPPSVSCECHCDCPPAIPEFEWVPLLGAGFLSASIALLGSYC